MSVDCILINATYMIDECKSFRRIVSYKPYDECPICYDVMSKPVKSICNHCYCESCYNRINICSICRSDLKKPKDDNQLDKIMKALKTFIVFTVDESEYNIQISLMRIACCMILHPLLDMNDIEGSYDRIHNIGNIYDF